MDYGYVNFSSHLAIYHSLHYGSVVMDVTLSFAIFEEQPHRVYRTPRCGTGGRIPSVAKATKNGEIGEECRRLKFVYGDRTEQIAD